jgi:large subunit ribosomal protein L21
MTSTPSADAYAVIRTGGKQYRVKPGQRLTIERLDGDAGDRVTFDQVLMVRGDDGSVTVGSPTVEDAIVSAEITDQRRGRKISVFKYKNKTRYRRLRGHRQYQTQVRIDELTLGDQSWIAEAAVAIADEDEPVAEAEPTDDNDAAESED